MGFIIGGVIVLLVGVLLFFARRGKEKELAAMQATPQVTAREIANRASAGRVVKVWGRVRCDAPLTAPISHRPCVFYDMEIKREYEYREWTTDSQGRRVERTNRRTERIANDLRWVPFQLADDTGQVAIEPHGAQTEIKPVVDTFDRGGSFGGRSILEGLVSMVFASAERTIGYHLRESVLDVNDAAYILGEVTFAGDTPTIMCPRDRDIPLIISDRTEERLTQDLQSVIGWYLFGVIVCGLAGLALIVTGLVYQ
ncbi:MAG: GIDE domain-containing protein [Armatimonadota bacterium]